MYLNCGERYDIIDHRSYKHNLIYDLSYIHCSLVIYLADCVIVTDLPEITVHPGSAVKTEGDNLTLSCNATANPPPTISWTRDGYPVNATTNSRISFLEDSKQLTITNVNRTDSGEYRCLASNSLGNDTSNASMVDIQCK